MGFFSLGTSKGPSHRLWPHWLLTGASCLCTASGVSPCRLQDAVFVFSRCNSEVSGCGSVRVRPRGVCWAFGTQRWLFLRLGPFWPSSPQRLVLPLLPSPGAAVCVGGRGVPLGSETLLTFLTLPLLRRDPVVRLQRPASSPTKVRRPPGELRMSALDSSALELSVAPSCTFRLLTDVSSVLQRHSHTLIPRSVSRRLTRGLTAVSLRVS